MAWGGRSKKRTLGTQTMLDMAVIDKATEFFDIESEARWDEIAVSIEAPGLSRRRSQGDLMLVVDPSGSAQGSPALRKALTIKSMIESRVSHLEKHYAERIEELRLQNKSLAERLAELLGGSDSAPGSGVVSHAGLPLLPPVHAPEPAASEGTVQRIERHLSADIGPAQGVDMKADGTRLLTSVESPVAGACPCPSEGTGAACVPGSGLDVRADVARVLSSVGEKAVGNVVAHVRSFIESGESTHRFPTSAEEGETSGPGLGSCSVIPERCSAVQRAEEERGRPLPLPVSEPGCERSSSSMPMTLLVPAPASHLHAEPINTSHALPVPMSHMPGEPNSTSNATLCDSLTDDYWEASEPMSPAPCQFEGGLGAQCTLPHARVSGPERPSSEATTVATPKDRGGMPGDWSRQQPGQGLGPRPGSEPQQAPGPGPGVGSGPGPGLRPAQTPDIAAAPQATKCSSPVEEARSLMAVVHSELQNVCGIARAISAQLEAGSGLKKDVQRLLDLLTLVSKQVRPQLTLQSPPAAEAPSRPIKPPSCLNQKKVLPRARTAGAHAEEGWRSGREDSACSLGPETATAVVHNTLEGQGSAAARQLSPLPGAPDDRARPPPLPPSLPAPIQPPSQQTSRRRPSRSSAPLPLRREGAIDAPSRAPDPLAPHSVSPSEAASSGQSASGTSQQPQTARVRGRSPSCNVSLGLSHRCRSADCPTIPTVLATNATAAAATAIAAATATSTALPLVPQTSSGVRCSIGDTLQPLRVHLPPRRHSRACILPLPVEDSEESYRPLLRILSSKGDTVLDTLDVCCPPARGSLRLASSAHPWHSPMTADAVEPDVPLFIEGKGAVVPDASVPGPLVA